MGLGTHFKVALNGTSLESRYFATYVDKLLYFNFYQFLLKGPKFWILSP